MNSFTLLTVLCIFVQTYTHVYILYTMYHKLEMRQTEVGVNKYHYVMKELMKAA